MRDDFAAFILTYGRPDNVMTYKALRRQGYTGRIFLVVDDLDPTLERYQAAYGADNVLVFSKAEAAELFDVGDNLPDRRGVVYARNMLWRLAVEVGARYFIELDDDYKDFLYRRPGRKAGELIPQYHGWLIKSLDRVLEAMVDFVEATGAATLAMSQGGDHVGGDLASKVTLKRKAMNSFVCDAERPFSFPGRINEDVTAYVVGGNRGLLFFTYRNLQLNQMQTQSNPGGMTDLYLSSGTYLKSFYSVMYTPSCVSVVYSPSMRRMHHAIAWDRAVPKIVPESYRKVSAIEVSADA